MAFFVVHVSITGVQPAVPGLPADALMEDPVGVAGLAGQIIGAGALAAALGSLVGGTPGRAVWRPDES